MLGDQENAADHFAGYLMLQFGKDEARALIMGAAYTYNKYMQNPEVMAPLKAFSDIHGQLSATITCSASPMAPSRRCLLMLWPRVTFRRLGPTVANANTLRLRMGFESS
jgi:hypothetical protein